MTTIRYANTFAKFGVPSNIPLEDRFFFRNNLAVVADGVTRDSIGCPNLLEASKEEIFKNYPTPSPAADAAEVVCDTFELHHGIRDFNSLKKIMFLANSKIAKLNQNVECDYLENDYAACVAATAYVSDNTLHYSYICDCGVIVWDKDGNIRFRTSDDKALIDPYINKGLKETAPWSLPEGRVLVRKHFRNNLDNPHSYGALTGEESGKHFIKTGTFDLNPGNTIAVFSDGFTPYFELPDFFENLGNLDQYVRNLEAKPGFGSEKTIIVMSLD